jgi:hypothetical protein
MPNDLLDSFIESLSNKEIEYVRQKLEEVASKRNLNDNHLSQNLISVNEKKEFRIRIKFLIRVNIRLYHFCLDNNVRFLEELEFITISTFRSMGVKSFTTLITIMKQYDLDIEKLSDQFSKRK